MSLSDKIHESFEERVMDFSNLDSSYVYDQIEPGIIDDITLKLMEVPNLFNAVNNTCTKSGGVTLARSLSKPLTDVDMIKKKQDSAKEIEDNPELRESLQGFLDSCEEVENRMCRLMFQGFNITGQYSIYRKFRKQMMQLSENVKSLNAETPYLESLVSDLHNFENSREYALIKGPVYQPAFKKGQLKTRDEIHFWTPRTKFTRREFKIWPLVPFVPLLIQNPRMIGGVAMLYMMTASLFQAYDYNHFVDPLMKIYEKGESFNNTFESIGKIDELMSFVKYGESLDEVCMPEVSDSKKHYMVLGEAKNPILLKDKDIVVANDYDLRDIYLTSITGPNSGGKTTFCKTALQLQVLAQIGSYIPALSGEVAVADKIAYQAPMFDSLKSDEGRFGTELKRTRDIFFSSTPKSFVVLDELAQGTTVEDELKHAKYIGNGFCRLKGNTLFVTHNHKLVDHYQSKNLGRAMMVDFKDDEPTHKLVDGISRDSHADRVAKEIGFSESDMEEYLVSLGL